MRANPHQLQQVVLNLVLNAVDADASRISLQCEQDPAAEMCVLTVTDDGPGVPEDKLETIFEPFYTTKPAGQGTGLGLAVVRGIVKDHGGTIEAERGPEGGMRFVVRLPLRP